jgi:hypothetical protein
MNIVMKNMDCHNRKMVELEKLQQKDGCSDDGDGGGGCEAC